MAGFSLPCKQNPDAKDSSRPEADGAAHRTTTAATVKLVAARMETSGGASQSAAILPWVTIAPA